MVMNRIPEGVKMESLSHYAGVAVMGGGDSLRQRDGTLNKKGEVGSSSEMGGRGKGEGVLCNSEGTEKGQRKNVWRS